MGDIDFEVISVAENSNKFQKTRFWKEKSVEDMVTLGPTAQATLVMYLKSGPYRMDSREQAMYSGFCQGKHALCAPGKIQHIRAANTLANTGHLLRNFQQEGPILHRIN